MIIPVRCFTCGKVLGNKWNEYLKLNKKNSPEESMDKIGLKRMCCRRMILCNVELIDNLLKYELNPKTS